jgi:hypothetical protein
VEAMTAPLVHAHDSRVHFKLDEIAEELQDLDTEIGAVAYAVRFRGNDAKMKVEALRARRQEIAADIAILREMLGVR